MKKKLLLPILALLTFTLPSCGEASNPSEPQTSESTQKPSRAKLTDLEIVTQPTKVAYKENEVFNPAGLVLKATYSDGTTKDISSGFNYTEDPLVVGQTEVEVSYSTKSVKVSITVEALKVNTITLKSNIKLNFSENNSIDLSAVEFEAAYDNNTTGIITIDTEGVIVTVDGKAFTNKCLGSEIGKGKHTLKVTYREKSLETELNIYAGYKIEAENVSNEENPTSSSYTKLKNSASDTDYLTGIETGRDTGNGSQCGIKEAKCSNGQFLGGLKAGNVIEFYFTAEDTFKADVSISVSSNWVLKLASNNRPSWTGDIQLNEVMTATANDSPVTINNDVVLPGGGSDTNDEGSYSLYRNFIEVNFGEMSVQKGTNKVVITYMTSDVMSQYPAYEVTNKPKYQNVNNSNFGVPSIDYLQVQFKN